MFHGKVYEKILEQISHYPVIDCHEHIERPDAATSVKEAISYLTIGYVTDDLSSADFGDSSVTIIKDNNRSTKDKWPVFSKIWRKTEHTAYGRVCKLLLEKYFDGVKMDLDGLEYVNSKLDKINKPSFAYEVLENANIKMILDDVFWPGVQGLIKGRDIFPEKWKILFPLPKFHSLGEVRTPYELGAFLNKNIISLEDYLESVFEVLKKGKEQGMIGIKDQSAYGRTLEYELTTYGDAERLFNKIITGNSLGWPERKPLDEFLFHRFMTFARELDMPVQLHTGHMGGNYNRVDKANARGLAKVLELHKEVKFDLFHGNWPYMGDLLFLAKNYPNVYINCCWLYVIDPLYAEELLMRGIMTVPSSKILGFGGDYPRAEHSFMHLEIARKVIASALAKLVVERNWITEEQAMSIAADWLFNNPNELFNLGFEHFGA